MASNNLEQLGTDISLIGEGPHWVEDEQALYFVDILRKEIGRYDSTTGEITRATAGSKSVGFIVSVANSKDEFVIGSGLGIELIRWNGKDKEAQIVKQITDVKDHPGGRLNDGKVDPVGRLYTGSMASEGDPTFFTNKIGVLVTISSKGKVEVVEKGVGISNGLAWNRQKKKFYFADSLKYNVREYDYDETTGAISNSRIVIDVKDPKYKLPEGYCIPDGMTIDTEGHLWICLFGGSRVIQVNTESGEILQTIHVPATMVTSATWGGKNYDELYITTGSLPDDNGVRPAAPAGGLFRAKNLNAKGFPPTSYILN